MFMEKNKDDESLSSCSIETHCAPPVVGETLSSDLESSVWSDDQDDLLPSCQWSSNQSTPTGNHMVHQGSTYSGSYCSTSTPVVLSNGAPLRAQASAQTVWRSPRLLAKAKTKLDLSYDDCEDKTSWTGDDTLPFCQWSLPEGSPAKVEPRGRPFRSTYGTSITTETAEGFDPDSFDHPSRSYHCSTPIKTPQSVSTMAVSLQRSPRIPQAKFHPNNVVKDGHVWQLSKVMELNGCNPSCASQVQVLWQAVVSVSNSRFMT